VGTVSLPFDLLDWAPVRSGNLEVFAAQSRPQSGQGCWSGSFGACCWRSSSRVPSVSPGVAAVAFCSIARESTSKALDLPPRLVTLGTWLGPATGWATGRDPLRRRPIASRRPYGMIPYTTGDPKGTTISACPSTDRGRVHFSSGGLRGGGSSWPRLRSSVASFSSSMGESCTWGFNS
jgi:hypothetical protein